MDTLWTEKYYDEVDGKVIKGERFPELEVDHGSQSGTVEKLHNLREARTVWAKLLRKRGYRPVGNRTWVRDEYAAVIVP